MEIVEPVLEKEVTDYDFVFLGGERRPVTLDTSMGDSATEDASAYRLQLASRPNPFNTEDILPTETVTILKQNMLYAVVRTRKQRLPTTEEVFDMKATLMGLAEKAKKTVN